MTHIPSQKVILYFLSMLSHSLFWHFISLSSGNRSIISQYRFGEKPQGKTKTHEKQMHSHNCASLALPRPSRVYFMSLNDDVRFVIFRRQNILQLCNFLQRQAKSSQQIFTFSRKMSLLRVCSSTARGFVKRALFSETAYPGECLLGCLSNIRRFVLV